MTFKIHFILLCSIFCLSCMKQKGSLTGKEKDQIRDIFVEELESFHEKVSQRDLRKAFKKQTGLLSHSMNQLAYGAHINCKCITLTEEAQAEEAKAEQTEETQAEARTEQTEETQAEEARTEQTEETQAEEARTEQTEETQAEEARTEQTEETQTAEKQAEAAEVSEESDELWVQGIGQNKQLAKQDAIRKCYEVNLQWKDAICDTVPVE